MDEPRLDAEFYRSVSEINSVMYFRPRSAQEKYAAVRGALEVLRATPGASDAECDELAREYDRLFDLVSFRFPDPAEPRAEIWGSNRRLHRDLYASPDRLGRRGTVQP